MKNAVNNLRLRNQKCRPTEWARNADPNTEKQEAEEDQGNSDRTMKERSLFSAREKGNNEADHT
jgi:hypothetical protein